jgi:hypothetical protein
MLGLPEDKPEGRNLARCVPAVTRMEVLLDSAVLRHHYAVKALRRIQRRWVWARRAINVIPGSGQVVRS